MLVFLEANGIQKTINGSSHYTFQLKGLGSAYFMMQTVQEWGGGDTCDYDKCCRLGCNPSMYSYAPNADSTNPIV